jgi:hypothetical protein
VNANEDCRMIDANKRREDVQGLCIWYVSSTHVTEWRKAAMTYKKSVRIVFEVQT